MSGLTVSSSSSNGLSGAHSPKPCMLFHLEKLPPEILTLIGSYLDRRSLENLRDTSPHLRNCIDSSYAEFSYCERRGVVTLEQLRRLKEFNFQNIRVLDISNSDITDDELKSLIERLPNIREINAKDCRALTENCLKHLSLLTELSSLNLSWCSEITDAGLAHLALFTQLSSLDLSGCWRTTDAGLAHLAPLTKLTNLNLAGCSEITDAGLAHLAPLTKLTNLNLEGCRLITDEI